MSTSTRFLKRDKNKNIFPENIDCRDTVKAKRFIGDLEADSLNVNEINQNDNGYIKVNDDTVFTSKSIKITDIVGNDIITTPGCFHISSAGDVCIFLEADSDNINEFDNAFLLMTQDGNQTAMRLTSGQNEYSFECGTASGPLQTGFEFKIGDDVISTGTGEMPTFVNLQTKMSILYDMIALYEKLDMNNNEVTNIGAMDFSTIPTIDNTNTNLLALNDLGEVQVREFFSKSEIVHGPVTVLFTGGTVVSITGPFELGDHIIRYDTLLADAQNNQRVEVTLTQINAPFPASPIALSDRYIHSARVDSTGYTPVSGIWPVNITYAGSVFLLNIKPTAGVTATAYNPRITVEKI